MDPILERYQALEDKIKGYNPTADTQRLFDAFSFADNAHSGQLRKSGEPYIIHPLAVAQIVAEELKLRSWPNWSWTLIPSSPPFSTTSSRIPARPMRISPNGLGSLWPSWWRALPS